MFRDYIIPQIGSQKLINIVHADIHQLHFSITKAGKPVRANRTIETLRSAFGLAIKRWNWLSSNPCDGFRRNPETPRHIYLKPHEIERLNEALALHSRTISTQAIKFLLLTGARLGETLKAEWEHIDLVEGVWVKPSHHTKTKKHHRVPLAPDAINLLKELPGPAHSRYVFPGNTPQKPLVDLTRTWKSVCDRAGLKGIRIHDLRHTFASYVISSGPTWRW
jgi:integrase